MSPLRRRQGNAFGRKGRFDRGYWEAKDNRDRPKPREREQVGPWLGQASRPAMDDLGNEVPKRRRPAAGSSSSGPPSFSLSQPAGTRRETHEPDYLILVSVVALAAIGILMVYSASAIPAYANSRNTFEIVAPQLVAGLLGLAAMVCLMRIDYRRLRAISVPLLLLAYFLLAVVLIPSIGVTHNGAARWLHLGPLPEIHPAEVAKLGLAVYLAHWMAVRGTRIRSFRDGTIRFLIVTGAMVGLVVKEPDLGTAAVIALMAFVVFFVAGANLFHLGLALAAAAAAGGAAMLAVGTYPIQRILTFLDPWKYQDTTGYHTIKGLEALAAGGIFGTGLGNDRISVPNDFNDFIFSVISQQLGLVGGLVVIVLFLLFGYAGFRTALRAPDTFGGLMAAGITCWICFQAFINIGVVLALLPVTGITLPFVSQGGSSLAVTCAAAGILLSISRETVERGSWNAALDSGRGYGRTYLPGSRGGTIASDD